MTDDHEFDDAHDPNEDWPSSIEEERRLLEAEGLLAANAPPPPQATPSPPAPSPPAKLPKGRGAGYHPLCATRGALFSAGCHGKARAHSGALKSQGAYDLSLDGPRLDMRDKQVWEAAMQAAMEQADVSSEFEVKLSDIAARMGSNDRGGRGLASIWRSMERLAKARVSVRLGDGPVRVGAMLASARREGKARLIALDPGFALALYTHDMRGLVDAKRRAGLPTSMARWLHDFVASHEQNPEPFTLAYIRGLCGYAGAPRRFPALLGEALRDLAKAAPELLEAHAIDRRFRSSDKWKITMTRGSERPKIEHPKRPKPARGPKRGGVAL